MEKCCVSNSNYSSVHSITSSSLTSNVCLGECVSLCILGYASDSACIKYIGMCLISLFFIIVCVHVFIHAHASTCCKFVCWSFHVPVCGIYRSGRVCGGVAPVPAGLWKHLGLIQVQLQSRVSALFRQDILLWWVNQCLVWCITSDTTIFTVKIMYFGNIYLHRYTLYSTGYIYCVCVYILPNDIL